MCSIDCHTNRQDTPVGVRSSGAAVPVAPASNTRKVEQVATNLGRRQAALQRRIEKDHDYRVRIWAQAEIRIRGRIAELQELGGEVPELFRPDFEDRGLLYEYAAQVDPDAALPTQ